MTIAAPWRTLPAVIHVYPIHTKAAGLAPVIPNAAGCTLIVRELRLRNTGDIGVAVQLEAAPILRDANGTAFIVDKDPNDDQDPVTVVIDPTRILPPGSAITDVGFIAEGAEGWGIAIRTSGAVNGTIAVDDGVAAS